MAKPKGGLGKGLNALFEDTGIESSGVSTMRISEIEPNSSQPRKDFDEAALTELARSIEAHGVLQPLLVRPTTNGMYQIVAGERRWRAARIAGLTEVPVVVRELGEQETEEIALIENLQREDLNPLEEAEGYHSLMEKHGMTQEQVASSVGKSRPAVANTLRILNLPQEVLPLVRDGKLSAGHAKALLAIDDKERLIALAQETAKQGLTVREVERLASKKAPPEKAGSGAKLAAKYPADKWFREMQIALTNELGRPVTIKETKKGGIIELPFYNKEELAEVAERLVHKK